jgi:integrase
MKYFESADHWRNACGDVPVHAITERHTEQFHRYLKKLPGRFGRERVADSTIYRHMRRIKAVLELAFKKGVIKQLPDFPIHEIDKEAYIERHWITAEEVERMLGCCHLKRVPKFRRTRTAPVDWWQALVYVTFFTAARIGQMLKLKWTDLSGDVLTIYGQKNCEKTRHVVLDQRSMDLLAKIYRGHEQIFFGLGPHTNLAKHFQRLCEQAGVTLAPASGWHSLRRGRAAVEFAKHGLEWAKQRLGHRDLSTTERHYLYAEIVKQAAIAQQRERLAAEGMAATHIPSADEQAADAPRETQFHNRVRDHLETARKFLESGFFDECAVRCRRAAEAWVKRWIRRAAVKVDPAATLMDKVLALRVHGVIDDEAVRILRYAIPKAGRGAHDDKEVTAFAAAEILAQITKVCGGDQLAEFVDEVQATSEAIERAGFDRLEIEQKAAREHYLARGTFQNLASSRPHEAATAGDDAEKREAMAADWALRCSVDEYQSAIDRIIGVRGDRAWQE